MESFPCGGQLDWDNRRNTYSAIAAGALVCVCMCIKGAVPSNSFILIVFPRLVVDNRYCSHSQQLEQCILHPHGSELLLHVHVRLGL